MAPISSRTHGLIDYATAAALFATPRLFGWDRRATWIMDAAAIGSTAYAHLTDYEYGVLPLLSMRQHLAVDLAEGAGFLAAAALLRDEAPAVRLTLAGYGLFTLAAAALTQRQSGDGAHPSSRRETGERDARGAGGRRTPTGAFIMDEEDDVMHLSHGKRKIAEAEWTRVKSDRGPEFRRHIAETGSQTRAPHPGSDPSDWRRTDEGDRQRRVANVGRGV